MYVSLIYSKIKPNLSSFSIENLLKINHEGHISSYKNISNSVKLLLYRYERGYGIKFDLEMEFRIFCLAKK